MKKIILLIIIQAAAWSCDTKKQESVVKEESIDTSTSIRVSKEQYAASGFEVGPITKRSLSGSIQVTGMLDVPPQNLINITAPLGGFLRSTSMLQGMHVTRGQVLAVIENPEYIQLQQDYLDTKSQVEFLETEHERQTHLASENVNAQKVFQKSEADLASMKIKNSGLHAKLKMINIDADKLHPENISSTIQLRAPMQGYVTQVHASIGAFVSPTDVIFKIVDTDHLHVELTCFERDISKIKVGQKIRFVLAHESQERTAKVYLIGREIDDDRTIRIHGHLNREDRELIPGMYLKAAIETSSQDVLSLPEDAVLHFENQQFVFVRISDEVFQMVEIKTGIHENGYVAVVLPEGMDSGVTVVIKNAYKMLSKLKNSEEEE